MSHTELTKTIENNLAVVERHFRLEATDVARALELYTDDIVWETSRGVTLSGKRAVGENYEKLFSSMRDVELVPLDRFATEERVVDDMLVRFTYAADGVPHAPVRPGARVEMRLVHIFEMRGGKIAKEKVFETWREVPSAG
ncbi:MAG TPA: nuclear transport factor 2 family protein [Pyrinomonadaceae bacterium]|jgi:ketosteroid isomerase-like protein